MQSSHVQKLKGFTLIELMITVAILGIISAIAYPSYQNAVRKAGRADAKASIMEIAQKLERCYTTYGDYSVAVANCGLTATTASAENKYSIVATLTNTTYSLTATATGQQANDTDCATFTLDNTGRKTGTDANGTKCWK
jgi:type IV pilus assembly protein PilE